VVVSRLDDLRTLKCLLWGQDPTKERVQGAVAVTSINMLPKTY